MRRRGKWAVWASAAIVASGLTISEMQLARGQRFANPPGLVMDGGDDFDFQEYDALIVNAQVRGRPLNDAQVRSAIDTALRVPPNTKDMFAWRDKTEETLAAIGPPGTAEMHAQLDRRDGYEADALQAALFRIENPDIQPKALLAEWGAKQFDMQKAAADPSTLLKISHIMAGKGMFPYHAFYVVEHTPTHRRAVVAVAIDGKVQPINDDAALAKFLHAEGDAAATPIAKEKLSSAAAMLAISRYANVYKPDALKAAADGTNEKVELSADTTKVTATVSFDDKNKVAKIETSRETIAAPVPPAMTVPATAPAPQMPAEPPVPLNGNEHAAPLE